MMLSRTEIQSHSLDPASRDDAVRHFRKSGFVVLEGILDIEQVSAARKICHSVLNRKNRQRAALPYEWLPRQPFREFAINPIVRQLSADILGKDGDSHDFRWIRRCPPGGAAIARVHRDVRRVDPRDMRPGADCYALQLSVDIMLTSFTPENGATQIWPGTQYTMETEPTDLRDLSRRAESAPFVSITGPAGSVSIRDQRAWHRSGINRTGEPRLMLSIHSKLH